MKKILLISTGGTIASIKSENGYVPALTSKALLETIPEVKDICDVDCIQPLNLDSTNMQPNNWIEMANVIKDNYANYDGFVITHGTDTMAFTASALSYLIQNSPKPIVITGAQRSVSDPDSDGMKNLLDSFIYAVDGESNGVQVVFYGRVINAPRCKKLYSRQLYSMESINYPYLAIIEDGKIIRKHSRTISGDVVFNDVLNTNVSILKIAPGIKDKVLHDMLQDNEALIIESFGTGGIPEYGNLYNEIELALKQNRIIVISSQVIYDGSDISVYHVGNVLKNQYNVLETYDMTIESAYTKLMWIMAKTKDFDEIKQLFYSSISDDIKKVI